MNNKLFLDTHIVVFLYHKEFEKIKKNGLDLIQNNHLFISPIVRLELQYLFQKKTIISAEPNEVLKVLNNTMNLEVDLASFDKIIESAIGLNWTRDVFDRIIVAHASYVNSPLLTRDRMIRKNFDLAVW